MPEFIYKTNKEPVKCVNCGNIEFIRQQPVNGMVPYECQRCHFVSFFGGEFAPEETAAK
ncbi:MAG: hypothetical protein LIQ30_09170 [Planctomycetes bacterium]|nr:hypothetical protein [Planctomycetota bacterium]MCD7896625.1 hypothetical protein [Planctomycetaceae bacterium]